MEKPGDREQRRQQKKILKKIFDDYDPRRHDAFVARYKKEQEKKDLEAFLKSRGLK